MDKTGIELIAQERQRQVTEEGYDASHDMEHKYYELAMAAACYSAPAKIYVMVQHHTNKIIFTDPWPFGNGDKRYGYGERKNDPGNVLPSPHNYTNEERVDLLIKAGAMIAAQIDVILAKEKL